MEQSKTSHNTADFASSQPDSRFGLSNETIISVEQRALDQIIFDEAITIGCDWLEAVPENPITYGQYFNLFDNGYASFSPPEITRIFDDWEDYQQITRLYLNDRQEQQQRHDELLLEKVETEISLGTLPGAIIKKAIRRNVITLRNDGKKRYTPRFKLIKGKAPSHEIIERYHKYMLTDYLLQGKPAAEECSEERKLGIALGFTLKTGKPLSSYLGSIKNSNYTLTDSDIERAAEEFGVYDYIFPRSKKIHQAELLKAARQPKKLGRSSVGSTVSIKLAA